MSLYEQAKKLNFKWNIGQVNMIEDKENRLKLIRILLAGKIKCGHCGVHFVNDYAVIDGTDILEGDETGLQLTGVMYIDDAHTISVNAARVRLLSVTRWLGYADPKKLMMDIYCGPCGHEGMYTMVPNPFMDDKNIKKYADMVAA